MITDKQRSYLWALMSAAGHLNPRHGSLYASAKHLPHNPTQRERQSGFDTWVRRLNVKEASEIIEVLKR